MKKILFLCSQNKMRSPTAEALFKGIEGFEVTSAGLESTAVTPVTSDLVRWADYIFCMESGHVIKLRNKFKSSLYEQRIINLDIPDEFDFMEERLINLLKSRLSTFFQNDPYIAVIK